LSFWDNFSHDNIIAAHRGHRAIRAENTILAFEASIGLCDFVELDVGFSKDDIPIVIHDDTLSRTSNAQELPYFFASDRVIDYTYDELSKLDFSSWFMHTDPFGTIASGQVTMEELSSLPIQTIPTLDEALKFLSSKNMPVNIEIKDLSGTHSDTIAVAKILDIIDRHQMQNQVIISSFNHSYLKQIDSLAPHIYTAVLQEKYHPSNIPEYLKNLGTDCYNIESAIADENTIRELVSCGINVSVFTINSTKEKNRIFNYGARAVFTDFL